MTIPMSAIDRVKELLAAAETECIGAVPCRCCIARKKLKSHAHTLAEELVESQKALKKVAQVECDDLIHFSLIDDPESCDPDCIRCPVEAALRLNALEKAMEEK